MKRAARAVRMPLKAYAYVTMMGRGPTPESRTDSARHVAEFWLGNKPGKAGGVPL